MATVYALVHLRFILALRFGKGLVNAVTVEVKSPKNQMSGFATTRELAQISNRYYFDQGNVISLRRVGV